MVNGDIVPSQVDAKDTKTDTVRDNDIRSISELEEIARISFINELKPNRESSVNVGESSGRPGVRTSTVDLLCGFWAKADTRDQQEQHRRR